MHCVMMKIMNNVKCDISKDFQSVGFKQYLIGMEGKLERLMWKIEPSRHLFAQS